jgi:uncharacterized protein YndB with AHSA1/START domain
MKGAKKMESSVAQYELEIEIEADPDRVWHSLINEINAWWLPDFHMVGPESTVCFEPRAGGGIIEETPDGSSLLWCSVHWIRPAQRVVYLVGHVAPDWGGPSCSHLKFAVEERNGGSVVKVTDAHFGHVSEQNLASLEEGWSALFRDGLKQFVEKGVRQDK